MPDPGADTVKIHRPAAASRFVVWALVTLGVLCLLAAGGWFGSRWWFESKLKAVQRARAEWPTGRPKQIAEMLSAADYLPNFVVCPVLLNVLDKGTMKEKETVLWALEFRTFGGCRKVVSWGGQVPYDAKPVPGMERWIARIPRPLLEDLHAVANEDACPTTSRDGYGTVQWFLGGGRFLQYMEPDNPKWREAVTLDDRDLSWRRVDQWLRANDKQRSKP